jgi:hypothetical protein
MERKILTRTRLNTIQTSPSQPTINLINNNPTRKITPISTTLRHHPGYLHLFNILRPFQNTNVQSSANMPSNMAMKGPHARVILIDLEDYVSRGIGVFGCLHPDGVAALGVRGVGDEVVVFAETFCEDVPLECQRLGEGKERGKGTYMLWPCMCMGWPPKAK